MPFFKNLFYFKGVKFTIIKEDSIIVAKNLRKIYGKGEKQVEALKSINLEIKRGEFVAILGPSGSGKTTLLNCLSGIDVPTEGEIYIDHKPLHKMSENEKAIFRAKMMGFVFQFFNLIPVLTAVENVELPLMILGIKNGVRKKALSMLEKLGMREKADRFPDELSGGEQQRVAIARALVHSPKIIWADEPTGALDTKTGEMIVNLLVTLKEDTRTTLVVVTHDERVAKKADRILFIEDGRIVGEKKCLKEIEKH